MARLVVQPGSPAAWEIKLKAGANSLGRNPANDFTLDDPSVSGSHCQIVVESGGEWANPETGELEPKLHLHWRLQKPARGDDRKRRALTRERIRHFSPIKNRIRIRVIEYDGRVRRAFHFHRSAYILD